VLITRGVDPVICSVTNAVEETTFLESPDKFSFFNLKNKLSFKIEQSGLHPNQVQFSCENDIEIIWGSTQIVQIYQKILLNF
jgi:hypothetical protein